MNYSNPLKRKSTTASYRPFKKPRMNRSDDESLLLFKLIKEHVRQGTFLKTMDIDNDELVVWYNRRTHEWEELDYEIYQWNKRMRDFASFEVARKIVPQ